PTSTSSTSAAGSFRWFLPAIAGSRCSKIWCRGSAGLSSAASRLLAFREARADRARERRVAVDRGGPRLRDLEIGRVVELELRECLGRRQLGEIAKQRDVVADARDPHARHDLAVDERRRWWCMLAEHDAAPRA